MILVCLNVKFREEVMIINQLALKKQVKSYFLFIFIKMFFRLKRG